MAARRSAPESPAQLGKRPWLKTIRNTVTEFKQDELTDSAAALTYYGVLSLFPALIALVSIAGLVFDRRTITSFLTTVIGQLGPSSAVDTFKGPITQATSSQGAAGVLLVVGIAAALWSASGYVGAFMRASNHIYEVREGRPFYKARPLQILVTLIELVLLAMVVIALVLTGPLADAVGKGLGIGSAAVTIWQIAKWPVLLVAVMAMLAILYYSSPNARVRGFKWVSAGSVLAVVVWVIASAGFAFYVGNFGSYNKTYGSLGGVIVFLVWMWISNVAILLGAELNAETERTREMIEGTPGADEELKLDERDEPKPEPKAANPVT
jgi:membrane protein